MGINMAYKFPYKVLYKIPTVMYPVSHSSPTSRRSTFSRSFWGPLGTNIR